MTRRKLLVLSSTYPRWQGDHEPGFVHELCRQLAQDWDVTVVCPHAKGSQRRSTMDGVTVVRYRYAPRSFERLVNGGGIATNLRNHPWMWMLVPTFFLSQLATIVRLLLTWRPDVIHAHWLIPQALLVAVIQRLYRKTPPCLVTSHGADLFALRSGYMQALKRFTLRKMSGATVVSRAMTKEIHRLSERVTAQVEPMGVDLERRFRPDNSVSVVEGKLLFVGRLVEKKGLKYLIQALPGILEKCPDAHLDIVGFGPEEQPLKAMVCDLKLQHRINFLGAKSAEDLPVLYQQASVFVAPFVEAASGDQEGLGLVVVEALGCGCPVVVSDLPACQDVLEHCEAVVTVPPQNVEVLAGTIIEVLRKEAPLVGKERPQPPELKRRFGWHGVSERYSRILRQLSEAPEAS